MQIVNIIVSFIGIILGICFAIFLEKKVWPSFNKKHKLGKYEEKNSDNVEDNNIEEK